MVTAIIGAEVGAMTASQSFGEWLRHRRRELDLTQDALARRVGCARITIRKLEADEIRPSKQLAELLVEQLGVPPEEREALVRFGRGGLPAGLATTAPRQNLPIRPSSFIGRERELTAVKHLLHRSRLVTLTGAGGIGKTRLALRAAGDLLDSYPDGVWWAELAALRDPALVVQAVAKVRQVPEIPNQPLVETLADYLRAKQVLLVLDNCEHLISACAQLADRLLSMCSGLKILVTSREALDILGETTWPVPSLSLPDVKATLAVESLSRFESVQLFADRAASVQPAFELTDQNAKPVVQICRRLSGMPLAIELAAARIRIMSAEEIASRLDDRFDLLTAGSRTAWPRHQTLRATIDWSFDLLSEPERTLFRRLAVFSGGFTLEAVETVAPGGDVSKSQVVDLLGQLFNKSLVTVETRSEDSESETRYGMLETIREYARQKLEEAGEAEEVRGRHLEFFAAFARQAEKGIYSSEQTLWFRRVEKEADNLRAAMDWPISAYQKKDARRLAMQKNQFLIVSSLDMSWERGYRREITGALKKMLVLDDSNEPTIERAKALKTGGFLLSSLNNLSDARTYLGESVEIAEKLGDELTLAWSLGYLGRIFASLGEYDTAKTTLERAVAIAKSLGDDGKHVAGRAMTFLGDIPYWQGDLPEARRLNEEAISFIREINNMNILTYPLRRLGYITLREGDFDHTAELFRESLESNRQVGHFLGMVACLAGFAANNLAKGNLEKAAILCGCVENLLKRFGGPFFFADTVEYERCVAQLKETLDQNALSAAWFKGRALTLEQAVEFALQT
jgi:predicted ATPase/DNA-binding XRE family transcriptional regulator